MAIIIYAIIAVLAANAACFVYFPHTRLVFDWDFESFSLVLKSIMLEYHKFPLHDPWVAGGVDILANPQSRAFSPSMCLEFFFNPTYVYFLMTIPWALLGFWGFYKLLKFYNISDRSSLFFSAMFLCSSYFGLHFSEGHLSFASWQALGLIFYLILNIDRIKYFFFYSMLMLVILLEGHVHVLIFSQIILVVCLFFNVNDIVKKIIANFRAAPRSYLLNLLAIAGISLLIASVRLVPALAMFAQRTPVVDYENMSLYLLLRVFFDPFQYVGKDPHILMHPILDPQYRFHEYGCYIGIVSFVILLKYVLKREFFKENLKIILLAVFFFWVGSGWLEVINPWKLVAKVPLLNNVHVASRLFIVVTMLVLILLAKIFDGWRDKPIRYWGLLTFLLLEAVFVRNYPFYKLFSEIEARPHLSALITSDNIDRTLYYAKIPYHYYERNTGSQATYDPAKIDTPVKNSFDTNYRGEIYKCDGALAKGEELKITRYIPGEIHIKYSLAKPECISLNTNNLLGWKVADGNVNVISDNVHQLLTLSANDNAGEAIIKYRPFYLKWIFPTFFLGVVLAGLYWGYCIRGCRGRHGRNGRHGRHCEERSDEAIQ